MYSQHGWQSQGDQLISAIWKEPHTGDSDTPSRDICPQAPNPAPQLPSHATLGRDISSLIFRFHTPKWLLRVLCTLKFMQQLWIAPSIIFSQGWFLHFTQKILFSLQLTGGGYRFQNPTVQVQILASSFISIHAGYLTSLSLCFFMLMIIWPMGGQVVFSQKTTHTSPPPFDWIPQGPTPLGWGFGPLCLGKKTEHHDNHCYLMNMKVPVLSLSHYLVLFSL